MDRCPHCGVLLEARLVAAIRNPLRPEACPKAPKKLTQAPDSPEAEAVTVLDRLAALLLAGVIARGAL